MTKRDFTPEELAYFEKFHDALRAEITKVLHDPEAAYAADVQAGYQTTLEQTIARAEKLNTMSREELMEFIQHNYVKDMEETSRWFATGSNREQFKAWIKGGPLPEAAIELWWFR